MGFTVIIQTDHPKLVRYRCVIEVLVAFLYVVTLLFGFFCECIGFCHRTESDLFLFLLQKREYINLPSRIVYFFNYLVMYDFKYTLVRVHV